MLDDTSIGVTAEVAEVFCDAQDYLRSKLRARAWRGHGNGGASSDDLSDEDLLASAWAELPGESLWSPVDRLERSKQSGPTSSVDEATVRRLASDGVTQREIAAEVGKAQSTVCNFMSRKKIRVERRKGVPLDTLTPSRLAPLALDEAKMVLQYKAGWSLKQVGLEHGCSDGTVRAVLHRNGVKCRNARESHRGRGAFGRHRVSLDEQKVTELRTRRVTLGESWESLGERYGIDWSAARAAGLGITWQHVPMPVVAMAECKRQKKEAMRKPKRIAPDGKVAASLYLAGKTTRAIGEQLSCHQKTVCRLLKQQGVEARAAAPCPSISADVDRVAELYSTGHSARAIGKILGRNRGTIIRALVVRGISIRSTNKSVCSNGAADSQGSAA